MKTFQKRNFLYTPKKVVLNVTDENMYLRIIIGENLNEVDARNRINGFMQNFRMIDLLTNTIEAEDPVYSDLVEALRTSAYSLPFIVSQAVVINELRESAEFARNLALNLEMVTWADLMRDETWTVGFQVKLPAD